MKPARRSNPPDPDKTEKMAMAAIEEARMVLPGIQALFGFQLIAAFNETFRQLEPQEQILHFVALVLVALAVAIIMAPAAYNRLVECGSLSDFFVRLASWLIAAAMLPLMIALCVEVYLLARVILHRQWICVAVAAFLLIVFAGLWYVFPFAMRRFRRDE
jgi:cytochrome bd-type quinol oxidase subunit 2